MPRQKLSEYRAKCLIFKSLDLPYKGWSIDASRPVAEQADDFPDSGKFVVKVDQGVKGRFKKGLVLLDVGHEDLDAAARQLADQGYRWLIVEPMVDHPQSEERYLSLMADRDGTVLQYTRHGGVDIEEHAETIHKTRLNDQTDWQGLTGHTGFKAAQLQALTKVFKDEYMVFLEINPYLVHDGGPLILDAAAEVDDAAAFFVDGWSSEDFRQHGGHGAPAEELAVKELNENSPASFSLSILNPDGGIFLLLSGGGASVVVADEVYNRGLGEQLANYGEYSGNPNPEETYLYTRTVLRLVLASKAPKKVIFIGGAVANFTDVAKTFAGVIKALDEVADQLREQGVRVFVRRGGPNQAVGLERLKKALEANGLLGAVHDPSTPLTAAVDEAVRGLS